MKLRALLGVAFAFGVASAAAPSVAGPPAPHYHMVARISGPDGLWDYASIDSATRILYVGKKGGLLSMRLNGQGVPKMLFTAPVVHMGLPIGGGKLIAPAGPSNEAYLVDGLTGRKLGSVRTGKDADSVSFDRATGLAISFNRGGPDATIFDPVKMRVKSTVSLPEKAEFSVADGHGRVFVNLSETGRLGVIDMGAGLLVRTFKLTNCEEPTGLARDEKTGWLISACSNGVANIVTPAGKLIASVAVGRGADAVFIDQRRRLAFVPGGEAGTLTVISIAGRRNVRVVQILKTEPNVRTGAVDQLTGTIYLPVAKLVPPVAPEHWPSTVPGSFAIVVVKP